MYHHGSFTCFHGVYCHGLLFCCCFVVVCFSGNGMRKSIANHHCPKMKVAFTRNWYVEQHSMSDDTLPNVAHYTIADPRLIIKLALILSQTLTFAPYSANSTELDEWIRQHTITYHSEVMTPYLTCPLPFVCTHSTYCSSIS